MIINFAACNVEAVCAINNHHHPPQCSESGASLTFSDLELGKQALLDGWWLVVPTLSKVQQHQHGPLRWWVVTGVENCKQTADRQFNDSICLDA